MEDSTVKNSDAGEERETSHLKKPGGHAYTITDCIIFLGLFWVAVLVVDRVAAAPALSPFLGTGAGKAVIAVVAGIAGVAAWQARSVLYRVLTTTAFAVALLAWLSFFTVIGTMVIQGASTKQLEEVYGNALTRVMIGLHLYDLFHSIWFGSFLVLLALSLTLVVIKKRAWKPRLWGHLLSHLGVVAVIAGGFAGYFFGFKGMMDLHEGTSKSEAAEMVLGRRTGRTIDLGFSVLLKDFDVEFHQPEYKLYLYRLQGENFTPIASYEPSEARDWTAPDLEADFRFKVAEVYPDYYLKPVLKETAPGKGTKAFEFTAETDGFFEKSVLFSEVAGKNVKEIRGTVVRFEWEEPSQEEFSELVAGVPEIHLIQVRTGERSETVRVEPGRGPYKIAGGKYSIKVLDYQPDFVIDMETGEASSRTKEPNNPAVKIEIESPGGETEQRWLFAKVPDFGMRHGRKPGFLDLAYQYKPGTRPPESLVLVAGETGRVYLFEDGKLVHEGDLAASSGALAELGITDCKVHESVLVEHVPDTRSKEWENPAVLVKYQQNGKEKSRILTIQHGQPLWIEEDRAAMVFEKKRGDVKHYYSTLAIVEDGEEVMEKRIKVNDPLHYKGYRLYQSNYKKEDPTYSGILVSRDPGLRLAWAGFAMMCLGVVYVYYVRPRVRRGKDNG